MEDFKLRNEIIVMRQEVEKLRADEQDQFKIEW
jgi:hypothetical protein